MARVSIAKELDTIKSSIDELSSKLSEYVAPTGEHEDQVSSNWGQDGETSTRISDYKEYTNLVVEKNISEVELRLTDKISTIKTEIGNKIDSIKPEKSNLLLIFVSVFLGCIISIGAIFIGIIPVYTENMWNSKSKDIEQTITTNIKVYIDTKFSEIKTILKIK